MDVNSFYVRTFKVVAVLIAKLLNLVKISKFINNLIVVCSWKNSMQIRK